MVTSSFVGRKKEQEILQKALQSGEAELVSVIGRRRIGKTHMIKNFYKEQIAFEFTGVKDRPIEEQLINFARALNRTTKDLKEPPKLNNWQEAFLHSLTTLKPYLLTKNMLFF